MREDSDRNDDKDFGFNEACDPIREAESDVAFETATCTALLQDTPSSDDAAVRPSPDDVPSLLEHQLTTAVGVNYNPKIQSRLRRALRTLRPRKDEAVEEAKKRIDRVLFYSR